MFSRKPDPTLNLDRFSPARFLEWSSELQVFDPLTSLFEKRLLKLPSQGNYTVVEGDGRPEQVSFNLYGTTKLWWVILWYNNMRHFYDLRNGSIIRYPSMTGLDSIMSDNVNAEGLWL